MGNQSLYSYHAKFCLRYMYLLEFFSGNPLFIAARCRPGGGTQYKSGYRDVPQTWVAKSGRQVHQWVPFFSKTWYFDWSTFKIFRNLRQNGANFSEKFWFLVHGWVTFPSKWVHGWVAFQKSQRHTPTQTKVEYPPPGVWIHFHIQHSASGRHLSIFYHAAKRAIRAGKPISDQGLFVTQYTGFVYTRWTAIYVLQKNNKQGEVAHVENWNQRKWGYPGPDLGFWRVLMTHVLTKFMQGILSNTQIT